MLAAALVLVRRPALVPTHCHKVSDIPLDSEDDHAAACTLGKDCSRCFFWKSYHGYQCKKSGLGKGAHAESAWKNRFTFYHAVSDRQVCWVSHRPAAWGGPWGLCCWACNTVYSGKLPTKMARGTATEVSVTALKRHQDSREHANAVKALGKNMAASPSHDADALVSSVSSADLLGKVPRLDRWIQAAGMVERGDSLCDLVRSSSLAAVASQLPAGETQGDDSRRVGKALLTCLVEPLRWRDLEAMRQATAASIAIDERDGVLLAFARMYLGKSRELYDTFLGLVRPSGTTPAHCREAIEALVRDACSPRFGKQGYTDRGNVVEDLEAFDNFRKAVVSAVADGGPTEQKGLYSCSPGKLDSTDTPALFEALDDICRDRAHRWRSVQKGVWRSLDADLREFLDRLVSGEHSLARMLQTSKKFQHVFKVGK